MHTKASLLKELSELNIDRKGTLLIHSSMKSIGAVEGGADTVLDVFSEYMKDGLLVFPTHTWSYINAQNPKYHVLESPSCVGILSELFRKRPGVRRSLHPTHSLAALGSDAEEFVAGDEQFDTPCARGSSWGKLLDRKASIMLLGVDLTKNTFMHGVEEWANIPERLTDKTEQLYAVLDGGREISIPTKRHLGDVSVNYWKVEQHFLQNNALVLGRFGDATVRLCDTVSMTELLYTLLAENPDLFANHHSEAKKVNKQL